MRYPDEPHRFSSKTLNMIVVRMCRNLFQASTCTVERNLSKDESSDTSNGGEGNRAGDGASGVTRGRDGGSGVASRGRDSSGGGRQADAGLLGGGAGNLNGRVLDRGEDGGVALGDGSDRHGRASRGLSGGGELDHSGGDLRGALGGARADRDGEGDRGGRVDVGRVGVAGGGDHIAGGGGHGDALGGGDGAVSRAVRDLRATVGDGVDLGGVDDRGGDRDPRGADSGRVGRAVGDGRLAVNDSDQVGGVGRGDLGGDGRTGQGNGSDSETHLDYCFGG
jgi:hypothetical protein